MGYISETVDLTVAHSDLRVSIGSRPKFAILKLDADASIRIGDSNASRIPLSPSFQWCDPAGVHNVYISNDASATSDAALVIVAFDDLDASISAPAVMRTSPEGGGDGATLITHITEADEVEFWRQSHDIDFDGAKYDYIRIIGNNDLSEALRVTVNSDEMIEDPAGNFGFLWEDLYGFQNIVSPFIPVTGRRGVEINTRSVDHDTDVQFSLAVYGYQAESVPATGISSSLLIDASLVSNSLGDTEEDTTNQVLDIPPTLEIRSIAIDLFLRDISTGEFDVTQMQLVDLIETTSTALEYIVLAEETLTGGSQHFRYPDILMPGSIPAILYERTEDNPDGSTNWTQLVRGFA